MREVLARAATVADRSVLDAFRILWQDLPYSARLVADAERSSGGAAGDRRRRRALRRRSPRPATRPTRRRRRSSSRSTPASTARAIGRSGSRDVRRGPRADRARRRRHRAGHRRRRGRGRRELPQPVAARADVRPGGARAAHLAVRAQPRAAGGRTAAVPDDARSRADPGRADRERDARRRVGRHVAVRRRAGHRVDADPARDRSRSRCPCGRRPPRGVARSRDLDVPRARRLAALEGLVALGVDPSRWWFQRGVDRHRRAAARDHPGVVLQALDARELRAAVRAVRGAGSRRPRRLPGMGRQDRSTRSSRTARTAEVRAHARQAGEPRSTSAGVRRSSRPRPSPRRGSGWPRTGCCRTGSSGSASIPATGTERGFEFAYDGATMNGYIDRIGPDPLGFGTRITDYKTGGTYNMPKANESLQLGIYYLAAQEAEDLKEVGAITGVELAYLKGHYRTGAIEMREWEVGSGEREAEYQQRMRERLLVADRRAAPPGRARSATVPTRRPIASSATSRRSARSIRRARRCSRRTVDRDGSRLPAGDRRRDGRPRADRGAMARDLVAARAVRARRRRGIGQDVGDGGARRLPGARRAPVGVGDDAPGVLPGNVLCLTFTNKATENLQQRIRRALAELDLAEGEEPEIMNYHGFAAKLLDRYGMLAGIEPDQRVLSPAQRTELCARVMDLMTFEHVKTETPGRRDRQHPAAGRPGLEPPAHARRDHRVQRGAAGAVAGAPLRPRVPRRVGADRAGQRRGDLPAVEARPGRDRLRRPDLARAQGGRGASAGGRRVPAAVRRGVARRVPGHRRRPGRS